MYHAPSFAVNSIYEFCLLCFFSVDFVGSGVLREVLAGKIIREVISPEPSGY